MIDEINKRTSSPLMKDIKKRRDYIKRLKKDKVDDIMRYCEICGMTWEYVKKYGGAYKDDQQICKYDHIPTIGKAREECPKCKKRLKICDLCETERDDITKQDGIWSCTDCDKQYPKETNE